jgi:hypothetical protein
MEITLQYFDGCPNWETTAADLRWLVEHQQLDSSLHYQLIDTAEAAEEFGFRGSPTVLINGVDPFSDPSAPVGLCCRIYMTPNGLAGSPTRDQLWEVIRAAAA